MRYGYFDEANKEYVIDRPDTPAPWANYHWFSGIRRNHFQQCRWIQLCKVWCKRKNSIVISSTALTSRADTFICVTMTAKITGQPHGSQLEKDLDSYKSECHHGTGYTYMNAEYAGIKSSVLYYVPLDKTHEVWKLKVTNDSDKPRNLSVFGYCEFTNDNNYEQDQVNLQYTPLYHKNIFHGKPH